MRIVFSVVGLLIVVAIVGMLAKRELQSARVIVADDAPAASAVVPAGTPAQQSQQLQRQVTEDIDKALRQGMQRNEDAGSKQ